MTTTNVRLEPPHTAGFVLWLRECYSLGGLHGSEVVNKFVESAQKLGRGHAYSVSDATDELKKAEALGWIVRGKLTPTISQRAFLGLQYSQASFTRDMGNGLGSPAQFHTECWFWSPAKSYTATWWQAMTYCKSQEAKLFNLFRCRFERCHVIVVHPSQECGATHDRAWEHAVADRS